MSSNEQSVSYLQDLQKKMRNSDLSVLVGAGFSKNVDDLFPSWGQLLKEMINELKGKQFEEDFSRSALPVSEKERYLAGKHTDFVNEVGYLKVASLYRDRMGYRESLEHYIEQRTPYVDDAKNLHYIEGGKVMQRLLTDAELELHDKLVNLPWNNIYTTNYDTLLEACIDKNIRKSLETQIGLAKETLGQMEKEAVLLSANKRSLEGEILDIEKRIRDISMAGMNGLSNNKGGLDKFLDEDEHEDLDVLASKLGQKKKELSDIIWDIDWKHKDIKRQKNLLTELESQLRQCASVVSHSSELAVKRTGNIIKLHGSLRSSPKDRFGFDTDPGKHYVIAQEDYESYPKKHEAFTQLMRISLLQEAFCLVGFSGTDPNFLAWISWVRDVVFRKPSNDPQEEEKKIYLISTSYKPVELALETFHDNHRIAFVPLLSTYCITFMENEVGRKIDKVADYDLLDSIEKAKHIKQVFSLFFDYLRISSASSGPRIADEVAKRSEYENLCKNLSMISIHDNATPLGYIENLAKIASIVSYNRLPSPIFQYNQMRLDFLARYLNDAKNKTGSPSEEELTGIKHLLKSQYYPLSSIFELDSEKFSILLSVTKNISEDVYNDFLLLDLADAVWAGETQRIEQLSKELKLSGGNHVKQQLQYFLALREALDFRFDRLNRMLRRWKAKDSWLINKAGLMSLIDGQLAIDLLNSQAQRSIQEHLYKIELLSALRRSWGEDDMYRDERRQLEGQGLQQIHVYVEQLMSQLKKRSKKYVPYGSGKLSFSRTMRFSNSSDQGIALQIIGLLMESGFQTVQDNISFISADDYYLVAREAFSAYPFPTLFYALQYSDEKMLKRLAQDYIYCEFIYNDELERIVGQLSEAYFKKDTPQKFKISIPIFLSELILAVDPKLWEPFFEGLWSEASEQDRIFISRHHRDNDFFEKAIAILQSPIILANIVDYCLSEFDKENVKTDQVSDHLYILANNPAVKAKSEEVRKNLNNGFQSIIDRLIGEPNFIFALGNLSVLLTEAENMAISEVLMQMDFANVSNPRSWRVLLHFIGKEDMVKGMYKGKSRRVETLQRIRTAIIGSKDLWNAGFSAERKGVSGNAEFIALRSLRAGNHPNGIKWEQEEVRTIYQKLLSTLDRIDEWTFGRSGNGLEENMFAFILEEMKDFLTDEAEMLASEEGYSETLDLVRKHHDKQRNYGYLLEGLTSSDHNKVLRAIGELMDVFYLSSDRREYDIHLVAVLNKLLLQSEPSIQACLQYISQLFYHKSDEAYFENFKIYLLEILKRYQSVMPPEVDIPRVMEQLVRIAFVLEKWGEHNGSITYFLDMLSNSRYNNIRYGLRQKLQNKDD